MGAAQCAPQCVANAEVAHPLKDDDAAVRFKSNPSVVASPSFRPSERPDPSNLRKTQPTAPAELTLKDEALADFDRTLRMLGKTCFDRQDFEHFLKETCGYGGDAGACFDELCGMVSKATTKKPVSQLDVAGMRALYDSREYASVEDTSKISKQLMGAVGWLFDKYSEAQSERLTRDELSDLAEHLLSGKSLFDEVQHRRRGSMASMASRAMTGRMASKLSKETAAGGLDAADSMADVTMDAALETELRELSRSGAAPAAPKKGVELPSLEEIDRMAALLTDDPQGLISKDQLLRGLLRLDTASPDDELEVGICIRDLDPAHTSAEQFVAALEAWVLGHRALEHHFLRSMSVGAFGGETAAKAAHYMKAAAAFNQNFNRCVDSTTSLVADVDPGYAEILRATQDEEAGRYDEEGIRELQNLGLDVDKLKNVPHREVYRRTMDTIVKKSGVKLLAEEVYKTIAAPLVDAFADCCLSMESSAQTSLAAVYFGSNLLMGQLYGKLSARLLDDGLLTRDDIAFLLMHSGCDPHLLNVRPHVALLASSPYMRRKMLSAVRLILGARLQFLDSLVQAITAHTGHAVVQDGALHNQQVKSWSRDEPTSLFDFTGHPVVHEFCQPHAKNAFVLDIGCGEGYDCRQLLKLGAAGTVGIDISVGMIKQAKQKAGKKEVYLNCNAVDLVASLRENQAEVKIMPGADTTLGCFDLAIAVFVFNYTTKTDMFSICRQASKELKPGGHFVFSVPHPLMLQASRHTDGGSSAFTLNTSGVKGDQYFSLRDSKFAGQVQTVNGDKLNVKITFHTVQDYFDAIKESGLEFVEMREASVKKEHMDSRKEFFDALKDLPLHIVFKVRKPTEAEHAMHKSTGLDTLPKKLIWSALEKKNAEKVLITSWPAPAEEALRNVVFRCVDEGIAVDDFTMTDALRKELEPVAQVAKTMRAKIQDEVGADLIRGIDVEKWGGEANLELMTKRLKMAYYILASLIGRVDAGARGRLFDVKASGLSSNADNVLFSVSNTESGWHTDGASRDRIYDVVALLCVVPATSGGLLRLSNGCNAFESLKQRVPKFLLYELLRPIPRDVLENGSGKGHVDWLTTLARAPELLRLRVRMNSYPIYVEKGNNLAMRYMRFWIETGFEKAGLKLSPLLRVAMDMLDEELDRAKLFEEALKPGDMCFCNNRQMLHARNDFTDAPGKPPRHQVRVWIQTQKV